MRDYIKLRYLNGVPPGYSWGWWHTPFPPIHIQTVDYRHREQYTVALEREGHRGFEPEGRIPKEILAPVRKAVQDHRRTIEAEWVTLLLQSGLIHLVRQLPLLEIVVYPGHEQEFRVKHDLSKNFIPEVIAEIRPEDIVLREDMCTLELFPEKHESQRLDFFLPTMIWGRLRGWNQEVHLPGWEFDSPSNVIDHNDK